MRNYLRDATEFQYVYRKGKRFEGSFLTVFVISNKGSNHRLGVTASKRAIGKAVDRNRAKRLLREAFRSSEASLSALASKYDWVLNAKSTLLSVKLHSPAEEFAGIVNKVGKCEISANTPAQRVD